MRRSTFKEIISTMNERLEHGCGTNGCQIKQPRGRAVNIQCRCTIRDFTRDLWWLLEQMEGKTQWEKEE